jgi:hypothetical protein
VKTNVTAEGDRKNKDEKIRQGKKNIKRKRRRKETENVLAASIKDC